MIDKTNFMKSIVDDFINKDNYSELKDWSTNNGPHQDKETEIRAMSHILYISCWLYHQNCHKPQYKLLCYELIDYIKKNGQLTKNGCYLIRNESGKDPGNGLVGQAWVLEALLYAAEVYKDDSILKVIEEHITNFKFDDRYKAWNYIGENGELLGVHQTFNQQVWFSSICLKLNKESCHHKNALEFFRSHLKNVNLYDDGVIFHDTLLREINSSFVSKIKDKIRGLRREKHKSIQRKRSVGYHSFNLVALLEYYSRYKEDEFFKSKAWFQILAAPSRDSFISDLSSNKYGYTYNQCGFELAYIFQEINEKLSMYYLEQQFRFIQKKDDTINVVDAIDSKLAKARIYEYCRCK